MTNSIRALLLTSLALVLSGCASSSLQSKTPTQISIPPAIDVPYSDVIENVTDHVGVNVRWGGQIIAVEDAEETTRLTVLAYPLNRKGQPELDQVKGFVGGRFIVETNSFNAQKKRRFLTVYGPISDAEVLTNGKLTKTIPVVTALAIKEWSANDQRYARERYRLPYNGLGFGLRLHHGYIGYDYYSRFGYINYSPFFYPYQHRLFNSRVIRRHRLK
ncbi:Slp family lipoprotein [Arenicella xantha]|uniref:Outer membrane lipoprotein n=1 Tax=Arenicella xantha TaxID=644221 RepID=A0A395JHA1_9GAMM|nr:Slp family lipoprotein [Arenicella xantha]RBP48919.1 outer membrane lipoprotein [Arenicella xantha]